MHLLADSETTLPCSIMAVFTYVADLENFARWFPGVEAVTAADELPPGVVGKHYLERGTLPTGRTVAISLRVLEACPPVRLVTERDLALLLPCMELDLEGVDAENCVIRWRMYSRQRNRLLRWTLLPMAARTIRRRAQAGLRNLTLLFGADRIEPGLGRSL
ncbi:SRPBCC family protein [Nocardia sp. NPDC050378]|uniref:SRPBCC family protein n=1 Tax=Nocardia sp. NPDC050378 TaxID=3155400 RepID=UPI0033E7A690